MTSEIPIVGGWSTEADGTEEVKKICHEVAKQAGVHFDVCIPKTFRSQIVNGTNYLVKVLVGEHVYLHVMIHQALNGEKLTVTGVQYPKTASDHLEPFEC